MRLSRLFVLSFVFTGLSLSAQAQYTSKSTSSSKAADKTETTVSTPKTGTNPYTGTSAAQKAPAAKTNPYTGTSAAQKAPAAKTNPYTGTGAAQKAPAAKQQPAQATFRPRPQPAATPQTTEDDELPSFDALEKSGTAVSKSAPAANVPPPPPPKGEIWFYIVSKTPKKPSICTWQVVLQNKTDTSITRLKIIYTLLGEKMPMTFSKIAPNASVVKKHGIYSEKCPALVQSKPKMEVVACKMGPVADQDCLKYIVVK